MSTTDRYLKRHAEQAKHAREAVVEGHRVWAEKDYGKFFRSRPGSADWRASCTCGWAPKLTYYGEGEAMAACGRHLRQVERERERQAEA